MALDHWSDVALLVLIHLLHLACTQERSTVIAKQWLLSYVLVSILWLPAHGKSLAYFTMIGLPSRVTQQTGPYVAWLLRQAASNRRVWVVGLGAMVPEIAQALRNQAHFRVVQSLAYGTVQVTVREREGG